MGKIAREKKHVGTHRSAGPFSAKEVMAAKSDSMDVDMGGLSNASSSAKLSRVPSGTSRRGSVATERPAVNLAERRKSTSAATTASVSGAPLSRGQRKRLARKVSVQRRKELGETMMQNDAVKQEGTLADLESLALSLQAAQGHASPASKGRGNSKSVKMTRNNRKKLLVNETKQLQAVLSHPSFQANPLATIHQHLENTMKSS